MENTPSTLDELITLLEGTRTDYDKFYTDDEWYQIFNTYKNKK